MTNYLDDATIKPTHLSTPAHDDTIFSMDTETSDTQDRQGVRVWLWGGMSLDGSQYYRGTDVDSMMKFMLSNGKHIERFYFHNLKFDGAFVADYLFRHGYKQVERAYKKMVIHGQEIKQPQPLPKKTFTNLMTFMGALYSIEIATDGNKENEVTLWDSAKLITMPIKAMPKAFNLTTTDGSMFAKTSIDYTAIRLPGYQPSEAELFYLHHDIAILAKSLTYLFDYSTKKMTASGLSLAMAKKVLEVNGDDFDTRYPTLNKHEEKLIRATYRGGFTYVLPNHAGKVIHDMDVYDINSMYPTQILYRPLPEGVPKPLDDKDIKRIHQFKNDIKHATQIEYAKKDLTVLFTVRARVNATVKQGFIPTFQMSIDPAIQSRGFEDGIHDFDESGEKDYNGHDYREHIQGIISLTSVDLAILYRHYKVTQFDILEGYKFHQHTGRLSDYVLYWKQVKEKAVMDGNKGLKTTAKLFLNGLYGKFGSNPVHKGKVYKFEENHLKYGEGQTETDDGVYIPFATFVTAWARYEITTSIMKNIDHFVYADTDSIHEMKHFTADGEYTTPNMLIDSSTFGYWKEESGENGFVEKGKFLQTKRYLEYYGDGSRNVKVAGMPAEARGSVNMENFHNSDKVFKGKLAPKLVPGGVRLVPVDFSLNTIKGHKYNNVRLGLNINIAHPYGDYNVTMYDGVDLDALNAKIDPIVHDM